MLDRVPSLVDRNKGDSVAVPPTIVNWREAFPMQEPTLEIKSFIRNGMRPTLIPILMSFSEGRKMSVKWHGVTSSIRSLKDGGPQGSTIGILEYLSLSNNNAENIPESNKFEFVDDLTVLEPINLRKAGIASYNSKLNVPSNVPTHNQIIHKDNLKSKEYISEIN